MKRTLASLAAAATLLASTALMAQSTTTGTSPSVGASPGTSSQGLPAATPQDLTGRSPGQMPEQATTPSSPSALDNIPSADPSASEVAPGGGLSPHASGVDRSGG